MSSYCDKCHGPLDQMGRYCRECEIEKYKDRIAELEQRVSNASKLVKNVKAWERLRIAALHAISIMPSGDAKANLRDAYDEVTALEAADE